MIEITSKQASWLLGRSEDWLRHSRCDKRHWRTPPHQKHGRAVVYRLADVLEFAKAEGIELPKLSGRVASAVENMENAFHVN